LKGDDAHSIHSTPDRPIDMISDTPDNPILELD
jgi:hypothetical protein